MEPGASVDEVEKAVRKLARHAHPDAGGERSAWDRLQAAREAALAAAPDNRALVPAVVVRELVRAHTQALERIEERFDKSEAVASTVRRITRRHTDRVRQKKRIAQGASVCVAVVAGLLALVKAISEVRIELVGPYTDTLLVVMLTLLAVGVAVWAAVLAFRAQALEHRVQDATDALGQRPTYLDLIDDLALEKVGDRWTAERIAEQVETWATASGRESQSKRLRFPSDAASRSEENVLSRVVREIGSADFVRIFVVKGIELGVLIEHLRRGPDGLYAEYTLSKPQFE